MSTRVEKSKTRIFKNAGQFILSKRLADGTVSKNPDDIYTSDSAIVQSITTKYSYQTEKMEDGNSFYSAAEHPTSVDASAEIVMNTFDKKLWEFLVAATHTTTEGGYYRDTADTYVIPSDGIVKINASSLQPDSLVLARDTAGDDFTMLKDGTPDENSFTVDYKKAILTFNTANSGKSIYVTSYKASKKLSTSSVSALPTLTSYKLEIIGENCDKDETDLVADNFIISNVRISGDVSTPIRQKSYNSWTSTLSITKPAAGENAIDWVSAEKSERSDSDDENDNDIVADATLSSLSIGNLTLSPTFSPDVTSYTADTSNATNVVTAAATDSNAAIAITNGTDKVTNGTSASWSDGDNALNITVTNGSAVKTYTVTVNKS